MDKNTTKMKYKKYRHRSVKSNVESDMNLNINQTNDTKNIESNEPNPDKEISKPDKEISDMEISKLDNGLSNNEIIMDTNLSLENLIQSDIFNNFRKRVPNDKLVYAAYIEEQGCMISRDTVYMEKSNKVMITSNFENIKKIWNNTH